MTEILLALAHVAVVAGLVANERRRPTVTLSWVLTILLMPGVGVGLYVLFGRPIRRRRRARAVEVGRRVAGALGPGEGGEGAPGSEVGRRTRVMWKLAEGLGVGVATDGNRVEVLKDGERAFASMLAEVDGASQHVHVQFYIYRDDVVGRALRDRLVQKAREGVAVRVLVDAVGSAELDGGFWDGLLDVGGKVAETGPLWGDLERVVRFVGRGTVDLRNHRKLVAVDGRAGFVGGMNVGREYWRGEGPGALGAWRDMHVRIEGPAVTEMQQSFVRDWVTACDEFCCAGCYSPVAARPAVIDEEVAGEVVQVVAAGPHDEFPALGPLYLQAIAAARDRLWVTTPYFVPTEAIEQALVTAALRGVDVRLLVPSTTDSRVVGWATRSWFPALVRAGAQVRTYSPGFIHSKALVVDRWLGVIGSANLDGRSLHLNFELNAFVYGERFADSLAERFEGDWDASEAVSEDAVLRPEFGERLLLGMARLLSPLL